MKSQLIDIYNSPEFSILFQRCKRSTEFKKAIILLFDLETERMAEDIYWIKVITVKDYIPVLILLNPLYLPILKQEKIRIKGIVGNKFWLI